MIEKLDRLDKELDKLFELLSKYSNEEINLKPYLKKWSIGENMYHLWLSETSTEKRFELCHTAISFYKIDRGFIICF